MVWLRYRERNFYANYLLTDLQAKKYDIISTFSDLSSIQTYTEDGQVDYLAKLDDFEEGYAYVELDSGIILSENLQDRSLRAGLNLAGYKPLLDPQASAWEWFSTDFEYAQTPVRHMFPSSSLAKLECPQRSKLRKEADHLFRKSARKNSQSPTT